MTETSPPPTRSLATPAKYLKGVGPQRAELLERLGVRTAGDLLFLFPRDYQHPGARQTAGELVPGEPASVVGEVVEIDERKTAAGGSVLGALVEDGTAPFRITFFNQPFRRQQLKRGMRVLVSGTPKRTGVWMEMSHPRLLPLGDDEPAPDGAILPVYPLTEGLNQHQLRGWAGALSEELSAQVPEVLPSGLRERLRVPEIATALREIHRPTSAENLAGARRRFIVQELLVLQLALALRRRRLTAELRSPPLPPDAAIDARIRHRFPFQLTGDQQRAIEQVGRDMARQFPMNRLVQGDVGSGKTVVAQYAMLLAVAHRHQAALMAPTEVLARQHYDTLRRALASSRVRLGLLVGSLSAAERRRVLDDTAAGRVDVLVGTQALLGDSLRFARLGLVVIDEQHKFGVAQRAALRQGGIDPHYLVLSATPIPRTLAMTLFGDLDVSTLEEKPPGRGRVHTYLAQDGWRERWWRFVAERLREGRQAFVVTPRITGGDTDGAEEGSTAERVARELAAGPLKAFRIGLLHGRMATEEKNEAMRRFAQGRTQVLVATTVVEVGIDVPNATVMTILGAEHFGLAQLHQLRGRVARGGHTGYVCVFTDADGSPEEVDRLRELAASDDGFALAEADFRIRGPGNLLGVRQSGLPPLRVADPLRDEAELREIRELAREIVEVDPHLEESGWERLRNQILRRYGESLELGDVA